jgi:chaperonin GroES
LATKLIPLADKIVIKPVVQDEVLASGIVIPDTAKEKPQQGEIVAAGPGRLDDDGKRIPMDLKVGDRVLYAKYSGQEIKIEREEYIVLSERDVLCKVQVGGEAPARGERGGGARPAGRRRDAHPRAPHGRAASSKPSKAARRK